MAELKPEEIPAEFDKAIYTEAWNTAAAAQEHPFGNPYEAGTPAAASWDAGFAAGTPAPEIPVGRKTKSTEE